MPDAKEIKQWVLWTIIAALIIAFVVYVKRDVEQRRAEEDRIELKKLIDQAKRERTAWAPHSGRKQSSAG